MLYIVLKAIGLVLVAVPMVTLDGLGIPASVLTPAGLAALPYLLIAFGRLVPRRTLEDAIHDRDEWRAAHRISESARAELAGQVTELLEHARTTDMFIRALPNAAAAAQQARRTQEQNDDG